MIATTSYDNLVGLLLAVAAVVYLVLVIVFPERF
jgi:hypothetical protein